MTTAVERNTIILSVRLGEVGTHRDVKLSEVTVKAKSAGLEDSIKQDLLHVSKDIFNSTELQALVQFQRATRKYVQTHALPITEELLKGGMYLYSLNEIEQTVDYLRQRQIDIVPLLDTLEAVYPTLILRAMENLGAIFDPMNYPSIEEIRAKFSTKWNYMEFDVGSTKLRERLGQKEVEEQQRQTREKYASFQQSIESALLVSFQNLITEFQKRLEPGRDGKQKQISDHAIEKFTTFFTAFRNKNVTEFSALETLVNQAEALITGAPAQTLNGSSAVHNFVSEKMERIQAEVVNLVEERSERRILLVAQPSVTEDEEEDSAYAA